MLFKNDAKPAHAAGFSEKSKNWRLGWTVEEARASAQRPRRENRPSSTPGLRGPGMDAASKSS